MCVCVCVCVWLMSELKLLHIKNACHTPNLTDLFHNSIFKDVCTSVTIHQFLRFRSMQICIARFYSLTQNPFLTSLCLLKNC